ncbi:MAG: rhodanese-like domain-containing protein [Candidatus Didemnitutus sp.]|nr:rhodanese-like domain-containing protein [Candidatus Didemnitutus sp.]
MSPMFANLREGILITLLGLGFALAANALSPRGLELGRDYFPKNQSSPVIARMPGPESMRRDHAAVNPPPAAAGVTERLTSRGLQLVSTEAALAWFRDPLREQELIVFVDARTAALYRQGHIPGAWQFNHYRAEESLAAILTACLGALKVIVYCGGNDCEDSEFAALLLRDVGVPAENLYVFRGGMAEWMQRGPVVELGERNSGQLQPISR